MDSSPGAVGSAGDKRVDEELVAIASSNVKGSVAILVHTVDLSAVLDEGLGASEPSVNRSHVERTLSIPTLYIDIGPIVDQELQAERSVCGGSSKVQRGEAFVVGLADIGPIINQLTDNSVLTIETGHVERRVSKCIGLIYLNRQVEQVFDDGDLSTGGCRVKRSVSSFVFAADLCAFVYQQAHHIQVTHESCPVQSSAILFIKGIDVGSFSEEKVYHLSVAVEGSVVESSASTTIGHVDAAQQWDDDFSASQRVIRCSDMQRRLPVLVPRVHVSRVADQDSNSLLRKNFAHT